MAATKRLDNVFLKEVDADTGAGSEMLGVIAIAVPGSGGATAASAATPLPVSVGAMDGDTDEITIEPAQGTLTNRSGTISSGGTSQQLAAALATRRYLFIQNVDTGEDLWFNFTTDAVVDQPSIRLRPGESYENPPHFCSSEKVTVIAATTGQKFVAKEA